MEERALSRRFSGSILPGTAVKRVFSRLPLAVATLLALALPAMLRASVTQTVSFNKTGVGAGETIRATITFVFTSDCTGTSTSTALSLKDGAGNINGTLTFVSSVPAGTASCTGTGGNLFCGTGSLPNVTRQLVVDVTIPNPAPAQENLTSSVNVAFPAPGTCNNNASFTVPVSSGPPAPKLTIKKRVFVASGEILDQGRIYLGDVLDWRVEVTNTGTAPAPGNSVVITDQIPSELSQEKGNPSYEFTHDPGSYQPCSAPAPFANGAGASGLVSNSVECTVLGRINPGETVAVRFATKVKSLTPGSISNTASVRCACDPDTPKYDTITLINGVTASPFTCPGTGDDTKLCLFFASPGVSAPPPGAAALSTSGAGRFQVRVYWDAVRQGTEGQGHAVPLTSDTGYFWFFSQNNIELVLKVVDGRPINGKFWVFYGALTNVEYIIEIIDSVTGVVQGYFNPQDTQASNADTGAFSGSASTPEGEFQFIPMNMSGAAADGLTTTSLEASAAAAACVADATTACLNGGRFQVRVHWEAVRNGTSGEGQAVPITSDTGYFWFFSDNNVELVLKVVDGRPVNGKFWVFYGALTNVQYTITITDTLTGAVKTYFNPQDTQASAADTSAF